MPYSSTDHIGEVVQTGLQPPIETVVSTISRAAGYLVLALATAGLFMIVF